MTRRGLLFLGLLLTAPVQRSLADCEKVTGQATFLISVSAPNHPKATAATLWIEYPKGMSLPGKGNAASVRERVQSVPTNTTLAVNAETGGVRVVVARAAGIATGELLRLKMDRCAADVSAESRCVVEAAGSSSGSQHDLTCSLQAWRDSPAP